MCTRVYAWLGGLLLATTTAYVVVVAGAELHARATAEQGWFECVASVGQDVCAVELGLVEDEQGDGVLGDG